MIEKLSNPGSILILIAAGLYGLKQILIIKKEIKEFKKQRVEVTEVTFESQVTYLTGTALLLFSYPMLQFMAFFVASRGELTFHYITGWEHLKWVYFVMATNIVIACLNFYYKRSGVQVFLITTTALYTILYLWLVARLTVI